MKKISVFILFFNLAFAGPTILEVKDKVITVNGKQSGVLTIEQPNGTWGYFAKPGDTFDVIVQNKLQEPTVIHWHGLLLPNNQDGVALTQKVIEPNGSYHYQFKLQQSGTYWMHSHYGLQEQLFAEAPLIIDDSKYKNQAVIMFQDFSFKKPGDIMLGLKKDAASAMAKMHMAKMGMSNKKGMDHSNMAGMDMSNMNMPSHSGMSHNMQGMSDSASTKTRPMTMDLNDVKYDAFLTNYHTPQNPQVFKFEPNSDVRLRFINGAAASNFWINLGKLDGKVIAVDGENIVPISGHRFPLAMGQRMDIIVHLPTGKGVYPILGQVEGLKAQTGVVVTTNANVKNFAITANAKKSAPAINYDTELKLISLNPLPIKKIDQVVKVDLTGDMQSYVWSMNNQVWPNVKPIIVKKGNRVELDITNKSMMMHPIHLHGTVFQMVAIDNMPIKGALRDTLFVLPGSTVKLVFDANEKGDWLFHCHMLYHMHAGMMTYIEVK